MKPDLWPLSASACLVLTHAAMSEALHAAIALLAAKLGNALQACREHEELSRARAALEQHGEQGHRQQEGPKVKDQ